MKTNVVIIGENEKVNKQIGERLAVFLELHYLDFDGYCDYVNLTEKKQVIKHYGRRKYSDLQKETLPQMQDFCDSVIAFDGKISRLPSVYKLLNDTAFIICISNKDKERYSKYTDIWVSLDKKNNKVIIDEIIIKLGEIQ